MTIVDVQILLVISSKSQGLKYKSHVVGYFFVVTEMQNFAKLWLCVDQLKEVGSTSCGIKARMQRYFLHYYYYYSWFFIFS
jgi:hypothetical protein